MEYYVHNKPNYKMYFILSVLPLYVGYCLGKLYGGRIGIDNFTAVIIRALLTPFPVRFTKVTGPAIAVSMLVYMMICLYASAVLSVVSTGDVSGRIASYLISRSADKIRLESLLL